MREFYERISNMVLTDGDKAECKLIAREIVKEVLKEHIDSCPHGISLRLKKSVIVGMFAGFALCSAVGSGGGALLLIKLLGLLQ